MPFMDAANLLIATDVGLYCPEGDFHIDPWRPVDRAVVTHAHADHACRGCGRYLTSREGRHVLQTRMGEAAVVDTVEYGESRVVNGVTLSLGQLEIATRHPVKLITPHVTVMVTGKVAADVDLNRTLLAVEEGVSVVREEEGVVELHAGQSGRWPTPPTLPESLLEAPPPAALGPCDERPAAERLTCLTEEGAGTGLTAQVALYQRATMQPARAELLWRESLRRFPTGVLHPEIRLSLLRRLLDERRFVEAAQEALEFEQTCAGDSRAGDVHRLRLQLEAKLRPQ